MVEDVIASARWVAVLRTNDEAAADWAARASIEAGAQVLELTFSIPNACELLSSLKKSFPKNMIGMGTVMTLEQGKVALASGADFLVSPHTDASLIQSLSHALYVPGVFTPSDIVTAHRAGAKWCKVFPASVYGPAGLKTLLGPMPNVNVMVTGGITESNAPDYLKAGAKCVGVGSNIFSEQAMSGRDVNHIQKSVKAWQNSIKDFS